MNPVQKMYNDWCDAGKDEVEFVMKNKKQIFASGTTPRELQENYRELEKKRKTDPKERLKIVRKRAKNYRKKEPFINHNERYHYFQEEEKEVCTFIEHAPADIEFLLKEIKQLNKKRKNLWMELRAVNNQLRKRH